MIVVQIDALLFWTILGGIGGLVGVFALMITIAKNRQMKREELERSCDELCAAISNSKIHTLLNNIIAICDNSIDDAKSIIEVQNELKKIYQEASTKWDAVKLKLKAKKHKELHGKLEAVFHDYQSCAKDAETIVIAIGRGNVDEVKCFLSNDYSQEIRDIVNTTSELYENDLQGFIKQIISLRFKDLDIPNYASQIRALMNESYQDENVLETQLLARIGNAMAQNALGEYYYNQKQLKKAFYWFKKSAEQGYAEAQCNLGACYFKGEGIEKDEKEAFEWCMKSAKRGFMKAQFYVGRCYFKGEGIEKDEEKAFVWFNKSAEQGYAEAQFHVSECYANGIGIEKDIKKAFEWCKKSAEQDNAVAQCSLGVYYINGICVRKDEKEAFAWYKKSAEQGCAEAQNYLGSCYLDGHGVEKDEKEAFVWYKKSAEQGCAKAQDSLGTCYGKGIGVEINEKKAFMWFKKSAQQGNPYGQYNLGYCYCKGFGCVQDYNQAFFWYNKSTENKENIDLFCRAMFNIGVLYGKGAIGFVNEYVAVDYFRISAQYGNDSAQNALGDCYEKGIGVKEIDIEKAKYWYGKAADQGNEDAIESLKRLEKLEKNAEYDL